MHFLRKKSGTPDAFLEKSHHRQFFICKSSARSATSFFLKSMVAGFSILLDNATIDRTNNSDNATIDKTKNNSQ